MKNTFILTDVLPEEIPLIYSNFSLFDFIEENEKWNLIKSFTNKDTLLSETEPYQFFISKNENAKRLLSLIHPISQMHFTKFIEIYDKELIYYFKLNNIFSCRYPKNITRQKYISNELTPDEKKKHILNSVKNYFKYPFIKITNFYNSQKFSDLELKYSYLTKIDIQNCFDSIYTHSIEWAFLGNKELAKLNRNSKARRNNLNIGKLLDEIMQYSNNCETNGIVVGPEFSRIVTEIILSKIDNEVYHILSKNNLKNNIDYSIVRYIDDIFIFTNNEECSKKIYSSYYDILSKYKLHINEKKYYTENRPFLKSHLWISKIQSCIVKYDKWFKLCSTPEKILVKNLTGFKNNRINELKNLITTYESQRNYILAYYMTTLSNKFEKIYIDFKKKELCFHKEVIYNFLDIIQYVVTLSPTANNILKFCKNSFLILDKTDKFNDIIFKKCYQLLSYNKNITNEYLNIIILMTAINKNLPEKLLIKILTIDNGYFYLSSITYYLIKNNRLYKYPQLRKIINEVIENKINKINYQLAKGTNNPILSKIISSYDFIVIFDFLYCPVTYNSNKNLIKTIINKIIRSKSNLTSGSLTELFVRFIENKKESFMKWELSVIEIKEIVERKIKNKFLSNYL